MADCIFCKIVSGEIPSTKIWEDDDHLAILDAFPNRDGQSLVITKTHFGSHVFDMPRVEYKNYMLAVKKAAKFLERGLRADRILMVAEGLEVDHAHVKLYPFFNSEPMALGTVPGKKRTEDELEKVANKIKGNNK